jgi:DnaJ-domain-containing protein 1
MTTETSGTQTETRITRLEFVDGWWEFSFTCTDTETFAKIVDAVKALPLLHRRWEPRNPRGRCWRISGEGMRLLAATNPLLQTLMNSARQDQAERERERARQQQREREEARRRAEEDRRRWHEQFRASGDPFGYTSHTNSNSVPANISQALAALYVTPQAPLSVIKAAYKALAVEHHPDHGGNHDRMKAINVAYDLITKWKNSQRASA